jgi:hypothetical protein
MSEQMELPGAGLSKENREKINTRIWIVGDESAPMVSLVRGLGYQVRCFSNSEAFQEEFLESEEVPDCDLVIVEAMFKMENLSETDFVLHDVKERSDLTIPVIFFTEENPEDEDLQEWRKYLEPEGAIYVASSPGENLLISKISELTKKHKTKE